jgi:nucleoside-triphosphatase THEP1
MIHLITGAVNQGKTTYLLGIYRALQSGDGFYNRKIYHGNSFAGQKIVHLATGENRLFSLREGFIPEQVRFTSGRERFTPEDWDEECRYDTFRFSRDGLNFGREIVRNALTHHREPIFIDEIGPLELAGQGFCEIFSVLVTTSMEVYVAVRKNCLLEVIHKFSIMKFQIIPCYTGPLQFVP